MTEKATLVVTATPNPDEMPSVQAYLQGVMPLLMEAGGELVKRQKVGQVINGKPIFDEVRLTDKAYVDGFQFEWLSKWEFGPQSEVSEYRFSDADGGIPYTELDLSFDTFTARPTRMKHLLARVWGGPVR